ncbi:circularly permuted type 2 ATP-grasp protein [Branchiibius sp. NY16-3462-2]|uniref:circularly permuted type 2 ATP-grasp protein n=1 Tax=Branchiibius sp. NY16-3462-2 TaxID=1807500 RepID=UPI00079CB939|nr:circularly permuted type 2 ATP-grasp protein [Branchiibius sp. NY16-3462-2]KYH44442.1 hypothetical protein AZH51_07935 [Branchiibius sp. NY16-3462-2]
MSQPADASPGVIDAYAHLLQAGSGGDEFLVDANLRDGNEALAQRVDALGVNGLRARRATVRRAIEDDGITYGGAPGSTRAGRWRLDPLPTILAGSEWQRLEAGLAERAQLLDEILTDLYTDQRLIATGVIPAEAILGHRGFIHQAVGTRVPGPNQLILPSIDLGRDSDGEWTVIGDRSQAPSGAGYAMADRRIIARAMPALYRDTPIARLRGFFDDMRFALMDVSPHHDRSPRVVLLSPGPDSETAFDQAFLAALLGFPLVQSEDLSTRDGRIWMRTTTGEYERVDVILRRVDAGWSDPLELRSGSRLGVPGLIEANRRGHVAVVNPVGAGILENPALLAYLPQLARAVLGTSPRLPTARTWWCGDAQHRREALPLLDKLVIKAISRDSGFVTRFGWELSQDELSDLRARIEAQPWAWALQDPVSLSTVPVVTNDGLMPRRLVLRAFGVARDGSYRFMPGGLGRLSTDSSSRMVSNALGGQAKDIWVLAADETAGPELFTPIGNATAQLPGLAAAEVAVAPRVADDLFWLGRYAERAEAATRMSIVADDLLADTMGRTGSLGSAATRVFLDALSAVTTVRATGSHEGARNDQELLRTVLVGPGSGSISYAVRHLIRSSLAVRELLSSDTWLIVSRLSRVIEPEELSEEQPLQPVLAQVLESLIAVSGLGAESMVRDQVWAYLEAGRRIERAQHTVTMLSHTLAEERSPVIEGQVIEAVLRATDSVITHRRRLSAGHSDGGPVQGALALLLSDRTNPRSVRYQLDQMVAAMSHAPNKELDERIAAVTTTIATMDLEELTSGKRAALRTSLAQLGTELHELAAEIERVHFVRRANQMSLTGGGLVIS